MTARLASRLDRLERENIRLCAKTLEARAEVSDTVTVSAPFARMVARFLRLLLEEGR